MLNVRKSPATTSNVLLRQQPARRDESNSAWLLRSGVKDGLILIGGATLTSFRLRIAQSHVRHDMLPSYWSMAALLKANGELVTAPLGQIADASDVPVNNGIRTCTVADYDDPQRFPNIAIIKFVQDTAALDKAILAVRDQRSIVDIPTMMIQWLGYIWGTNGQGNPLADGVGIPSAVLMEAIFGIAGIELTPGLASQASCPEAIWQAAKWWHAFYDAGSKAPAVAGRSPQMVPRGCFVLRQPEAAITEQGSKPARRRRRPK